MGEFFTGSQTVHDCNWRAPGYAAGRAAAPRRCGNPSSRMTRDADGGLAPLDDALHALWRHGRNLLLSWCPDDAAISVLVVPTYLPAAIVSAAHDDARAAERSLAVTALIGGSKQVDRARMRALASLIGVLPHRIALGARLPPADEIEELPRRYSVSHFTDRTVVLFDIVGFSLADLLSQLTQLKSLAYSINVSCRRRRTRMRACAWTPPRSSTVCRTASP